MKRTSLALLIGLMACCGLNAQKPEAIISKASTAPLIDGVIDEVWNEAYPGNSVAIPFGAENPTLGNPGDTYWRALWTGEGSNPEGLYILLVVADDDFYPSYISGGAPWMYDLPEFYFDVNELLEDGNGPSTVGSGHYKTGAVIVEGKTNGEVITDASGMIYAVMVNEPTYLVECYFPLSMFETSEGYEPDFGQAIGFDLVINDNDRTTENRDRASWSNDGEVAENFINMDDAGLVYFEGALGNVLIESISLETGAGIDTDNGKRILDYTVSPVVANEEDLQWSVSNGSGRARIDQFTGEIAALVDGTVWVKLTSRNAVDSCEVSISNQFVTRGDISYIRNGTFDEVNEDGTAREWNGSSKVVDGVLFLENPGDPDGDLWDCKISQEDMGCNNTDFYTLSFDLSASAPGEVLVLFEDKNSLISYGVSDHEFASPLGRSAWDFTSSVETVRYSFDVLFDQLLPDTKELFAFMLGQHSGDVSIDNVELICTADLDLLTYGPYPENSDFPERSRDRLVAKFDLNGHGGDDSGILPRARANNLEWTGNRFCQSEKAARMTGQNSYLEIADHDSLDLAGPFSLSFWLRLDSIPSEETSIVFKGDPLDPVSASYWVSISPGEDNASGSDWSFSCRDETAGLKTFKSEGGIMAGEWMCYTLTSDGDSVILYSGSEKMAGFEEPLGTLVNNDESLYLGNLSNLNYTAKLDQLVIYRRSLSSAEIASYFQQNKPVTDAERTTIEVCPGNVVELAAYVQDPISSYTFMRQGEVIQQGPESSCEVQIYSRSDMGEYSCIAENCFDSLIVYFDLEYACDPEAFQILNQTRDIECYPGHYFELKLDVLGTMATTFQWTLNGVPTDYDARRIIVSHMSEADSGTYVCEVRDGDLLIKSEPIHVVMLDRESRPEADTLGLKAWYTFKGDYLDRTDFTGPGIAQGLEQDSGVYEELNEASLFDGESSFLEVPADGDLDMEGAFTMMLIFRLDQTGAGREPILMKTSLDEGSPDNYSLYIDQGRHLQFSVTMDDGTEYTHISDWTMEEDTWYLLYATYDGSQLSCYLNDNPSNPLDIPEGVLKTSDGPLVIGSKEASEISFLMDDFKLYNRAMDQDEISEHFAMHVPQSPPNLAYLKGCTGDTIDMSMDMSGPFVNCEFSKDGKILQSGSSPYMLVPINSDDDLGIYHCIGKNGFMSLSNERELKSGRLYDDLTIDKEYVTEIFASPGDQVNLSFGVNSNYEFLEYFLYHDEEVIPDAFRGIWTIESVDYDDAGDYYFVVMNGCERMVSDTVHLYVDGGEFVDFEVPGWDWTGNVSGSGNSYFSSIGLAADGSFGLLGYYSGGLRVEGEEVFSSVSDDIFITVYDEKGEHLWSQFLKSPFYKGKADLAFDNQGNLYVCGSFTEEIVLFGDTITNADNSRGFLAKLNTEGELIWIKTIQSTGVFECSQVKIDSQDRIYLGGNFTGSMSIDDQDVTGSWDECSNHMFLASLDATGSCQWIRHAVICDMEFFGLVDMELTSLGEPVVCGTYVKEADFGDGVLLSTPVEAPFLVKYDAQGTPQWGTTISTESGFAETFDVSVDDLDRVFMTGMHLGDVAFGEYEVTVEGDVMEEIFLARFDESGICTALSSYGSQGDGADFGFCYEPDSDTTGYLMGIYGDTLIMGIDRLEAVLNTGSALISSNMFIAQLKDNGEALALRSAGVKSNGFFGEIATVSDGRLIFAGLNSFDAIQKASNAIEQNIAFTGFKENGLLNNTLVEKKEQKTICEGDSVLFHGQWCSSAGNYEYVKAGIAGADTLIILELSTEVCTGVEEGVKEDIIRVFPNPASTILYVESGDVRVFDMTLYDLNGKLLTRKNGEAHYELSVDKYPAGLHLLVVNRDGNMILKRIMIE